MDPLVDKWPQLVLALPLFKGFSPPCSPGYQQLPGASFICFLLAWGGACIN